MDPQLPEGYPWPIYQYTWLIAISAFACGFTIAGMGPAILYIPTSIPLSTAETTMMVSVVLFGALPGTFAAGWLGDRWGRRPVIIASEILGAISTTCMALSQQSWQLIVAHGMAGIALGAFSVCAGLFSAETSPPELRGSLSGYGQLAGWVGGIMAYLFGLLLIFTVAPDLTWRLIFGGAALCFVSAAIVLVWLLPESPRWLIHRGRDNDALKILHRIYGVGREHQAHSEYQIIKAYVEDTGKQPQSYRDFGKQENRRPLVMALLLYALHQLSGNNMITFYSSIILHELGLTAEMSILATYLTFPDLLY
jgi:SP family arabinose:H+ symporter-like MFS transporter